MGQSPKLEFGELLKQHRQARAWSQVELARKVDLSSSYISKLERRGQVQPSGGFRAVRVPER